jgi:protein-disulfide isomerase-like protein with CxxC motif
VSNLHARYGDAFHERLKRSFEASLLVYNPLPDVVPNTMRALSLTEFARDRGLHRPMHDRLMEAYWEEARNIGDPEVLREEAVEVGLSEDEVAAAIEDSGLADRVRASTAHAQSLRGQWCPRLRARQPAPGPRRPTERRLPTSAGTTARAGRRFFCSRRLPDGRVVGQRRRRPFQ